MLLLLYKSILEALRIPLSMALPFYYTNLIPNLSEALIFDFELVKIKYY